MLSTRPLIAAAILLLVLSGQSFAQDLEPRRWTSLPPGLSVVGAGYVATRGDVFFDPVLLVEDAEVTGDTLIASFIHSFKVAGKSARIDFRVPWQNLYWEGLLDGEPASTQRIGLADPWVRFSMILMNRGSGKPGAANTVIGAGLTMGLPLGEYLEGRLLNLGNNRFFVRPQMGVVHTRGKWSYELTGSAFFYSDNDDFLVDSTLEQKTLYAAQAHVIRFFDKPGWWTALSAGYASGGETKVNGVRSDNRRRQFLSALSLGFPLGKSQGVKITWLRNETRTDTGADTDSLALAWSYRF